MVNLDRRFSEWRGKGQGDPELYQYVTKTYGTLDWPALLKRRRVVILAEAGSGKTTEFIEQDELAISAGKFSFRTTVRAAGEKGFASSLTRQKTGLLEAWRQSQEPAWFFLDSVDEAKARGADFVSALESLADAIAGGEERAFVFISGRHSDWEMNRDGMSLSKHLRVPEMPKQEAVVDVNMLVVNAIRGVKADAEVEVEKPTIVVMLPLDESRIEMFVRAQGIDDFDAFFDAMNRSNLLAFARRPLDLNWLAEYWIKNKRFGSLAEMLGLSLAQRSLEKDPAREKIDTLSPEVIRPALERIGAALVLQRLDSIVIPDEGIAPADKLEALELVEILTDWTGANRNKLIVRPVFDPANAGYVRLHNDNQGVVRSYLTAHWLERMRSAHCPIKNINELLFAESYGIKLVRPTMRETAAWLAILNPDVAREAIARDPWLFLECGDPGSLGVEVRSKALSAVLNAIRGEEGIAPIKHDALRRFAKLDLCEMIRSSWAEHKDEPAPRELLLQIIWLGELAPCVDLAIEASFGKHGDRYSQFYAARALIGMGGADDRARFVDYLRANSATISSDVFWDGAASLFPNDFDVADLLAALAVPALRANSSAYGPSYKGEELVQRITSAVDAETLLRGLLAIVQSEAVENEQHALTKMLETCAARLIDLCATDVPPTLTIDTGLFIAKLDRYQRARDVDDDGGVLAKLRATPSSRRAVFWRAVDERTRNESEAVNRHLHLHQLEYYAFSLNLGSADIDWLLEDATIRQDHGELIANTSMRIWRNADESEEILRKITAVAARHESFKATVELWLTPRKPTGEELEMNESTQERIRKTNEQRIKDDKSWNEFSDHLRSNPLQLRDCLPPSDEGVDTKLLNLWRVLSRIQGNQNRYSNTDLIQMIPLFGAAVVSEFRSALMAQWRLWWPKLRIDRPIHEKNSHGMPDIIGILGISIEAESIPNWALTISDADAELAVNYATQELNRFPVWFGAFCQSRPEMVGKVLNRWIDQEWIHADANQRRDLLEDFGGSDAAICAAVAQHVMANFETLPTTSIFVVEPALQIVFKGLGDRERLLSFALGRFDSEESNELKACYMGVAYAINPEESSAALELAIAKLDPAGQSLLGQSVMPRIFGNDWFQGGLNVDSIPTSTLEKLVHLAYRTIRVEDDMDRANGKAYSPGFRDHAQTARSKAFNALVKRSGRDVFDAINRMAAKPDFPIDRRHLLRLAYERAANDSETSTWKSEDVVAFETSFNTVPRTAKDLQRVALSRLDDLQYELIHGDFNQGVTLAGLVDERQVQNWVADRLRGKQAGSYSVEREPHVAGEKEPDIRLRARSTDVNIPIEIKVTKYWSLPDLEVALTDQMMGKYLRDRENRWGILLIVQQVSRPLGWRKEDRTLIGISDVVEHLTLMANSIASSGQFAAQMDVVLIDVSGIMQPAVPVQLPRKVTA